MSNPTANFGWVMPDPTDLVTNLPADFEVFGQAVDSDFADLKGGTTGQVLSKTSNTDLDFTWVSANPGDITSVGVTSPITGGGTSGEVTIGIQDGTTAQKGAVQLENSTSSTSTTNAAVPAAVKSAYDLAAAAIPKSTGTTAGDVIYYTGASTPVRLGIGTAGQVLSVSSGAPAWTTAAAGGLTLLSTTTLSGASTTISSISQSYKNLYIYAYGLTNSTSNGIFRVATNGSTNAYISGTYGATNYDVADVGYIQNGKTYSRTADFTNFTIVINYYSESVRNKVVQVWGYTDGSFNSGGMIQSASAFAVNELTFSNSGGNWASGTVKIYGA